VRMGAEVGGERPAMIPERIVYQRNIDWQRNLRIGKDAHHADGRGSTWRLVESSLTDAMGGLGSGKPTPKGVSYSYFA